MTKKIKARIEIAADGLEIMRAIRKSKLLSKRGGRLIYSLSASGRVRQSMSFANSEYSCGYDWATMGSGSMSADDFRAFYIARGFKITEHRKPKKINYNKASTPIRDGKDDTMTGRVAEIIQAKAPNGWEWKDGAAWCLKCEVSIKSHLGVMKSHERSKQHEALSAARAAL